MKKIFKILFVVLILLFNSGCNKNELEVQVGMDKDIALKIIDEKAEKVVKSPSFCFCQFENRNYVIKMDYDYLKVETIKSFKIKYGNNKDFKKVKALKDDIYDLVKRVGIPIDVSSNNSFIFETKEGIKITYSIIISDGYEYLVA